MFREHPPPAQCVSPSLLLDPWVPAPVVGPGPSSLLAAQAPVPARCKLQTIRACFPQPPDSRVPAAPDPQTTHLPTCPLPQRLRFPPPLSPSAVLLPSQGPCLFPAWTFRLFCPAPAPCLAYPNLLSEASRVVLQPFLFPAGHRRPPLPSPNFILPALPQARPIWEGRGGRR